MADVQLPSQEDVIHDVKKEEITHEEIHLPADAPFSPEDYTSNANCSLEAKSPRDKSLSVGSDIGSDEANDLKCQEVLVDKDDVEMGAEVEVGAEPPRKRGRGRPRGSTSQRKIKHMKKTPSVRSSPRYDSTESRNYNMSPRQSCPDIIAHTVAPPQLVPPTPPSVKRGRGRPPKVKAPQVFPQDHVAQLNHLNNLNEVMNSPLLTQGAHNLKLSPHQLLLQQHQLYEQTRRLIQQQQMLLTQHQQAAMLAGSHLPLSPTILMGYPEPAEPPLLTPTSESGVAVKRGRGRPKGSTKPPKLPKIKSTLNPDGTPRQKRPYKKRQPKSDDGEECTKAKRKYTRKMKGESSTSDKLNADGGSQPVVKEKGKRGRKPKNQSASVHFADEKVGVKKERKPRERKPREKKPRKEKGSSHLPNPVALRDRDRDRDSDGGSSTDSVVFCSEEPPPPIMSSPTYNPNSSGSSNSRHHSSNNNNHKDRGHTSHTTKPAPGLSDDTKLKKSATSPVISRLEDSSSDSSSGSSSSDDSESSSSDDDSSSSSSHDGNNSSSKGSRTPSPAPALKKHLNEESHAPMDAHIEEDGGHGVGANGEFKHRSADSPSWWYTSQNNESGDTDSDGEDQYRQYNSNSPPPRSPSSASSESPDKSYQCHVCRKWFSSPVTLRIHKRSHQVKPNSGGSSSGGRAPRRYECDCCEATFTRRERLEQHRSEKHRGTLTERCEVCGRGFEDEEQQKKHLATHTADERAGRCSECGATYNTWEQLRRHRSTHTPPASYVCNLCRKSFTYSHSLTRHLSNHTKAVYRCVVCKMSFNDYDSLAQHLNSHLDRYKQLKTS